MHQTERERKTLPLPRTTDNAVTIWQAEGAARKIFGRLGIKIPNFRMGKDTRSVRPTKQAGGEYVSSVKFESIQEETSV